MYYVVFSPKLEAYAKATLEEAVGAAEELSGLVTVFEADKLTEDYSDMTYIGTWVNGKQVGGIPLPSYPLQSPTYPKELTLYTERGQQWYSMGEIALEALQRGAEVVHIVVRDTGDIVSQTKTRKAGSARGQIKISDDFDE